MKKILLFVISGFLLGCNQSKRTDYTKKTETSEIVQKVHAGKKLLKEHCFVCHNPSTPEKSRIAPHMIAIKAHYITESTSKKEFTDQFISFVKHPTKEKAKMRGAVRRFGLMPSQNFMEDHLKKIAEYLYEYQIEEPSWFKEHWKEHKGKSYINTGKMSAKTDREKTPTDIGLEYALGTKKVLGKNLMTTIQDKGTLAALNFCNQNAYPLTDSMSVKFNAIIKRVSDKPRNQKNKASQKELDVIHQYKQLVSEKATINPIIEKSGNDIQFYYPIITNSMCLQCHGTPNEQIKPITLKKITALYPKDMATGYDVDQVRGIWSISFRTN